jgi:Transcription factor WhiB
MTTPCAHYQTHCSPWPARDQRTPCQGRYSELWTSEDYTQRAETIPLCTGCDLLDLCAQYATELKASFGVWAGIDRTPTTRQTRQPTAPTGETS